MQGIMAQSTKLHKILRRPVINIHHRNEMSEIMRQVSFRLVDIGSEWPTKWVQSFVCNALLAKISMFLEQDALARQVLPVLTIFDIPIHIYM